MLDTSRSRGWARLGKSDSGPLGCVLATPVTIGRALGRDDDCVQSAVDIRDGACRGARAGRRGRAGGGRADRGALPPPHLRRRIRIARRSEGAARGRSSASQRNSARIGALAVWRPPACGRRGSANERLGGPGSARQPMPRPRHCRRPWCRVGHAAAGAAGRSGPASSTRSAPARICARPWPASGHRARPRRCPAPCGGAQSCGVSHPAERRGPHGLDAPCAHLERPQLPVEPLHLGCCFGPSCRRVCPTRGRWAAA